MSFDTLKHLPRTQRGALAIAVSPGLLLTAALVGFTGMAAGAIDNIPYGLGLLALNGIVVFPLVFLLVYLPSAVLIGRRLLPGERPTTERLLRVLGASGAFGVILGGSCGWISLGGYALLNVDWVGSWLLRILLVVVVWAAVATFAAVRIGEAGLKATAPKRRRKPAAKKTPSRAKTKTAPRKRAAGNSGTTSMTETPDAAGA